MLKPKINKLFYGIHLPACYYFCTIVIIVCCQMLIYGIEVFSMKSLIQAKPILSLASTTVNSDQMWKFFFYFISIFHISHSTTEFLIFIFTDLT